MSKKIIFSVLIAVILLGGISGVVADRYLFPYLATSSFFSKCDFLKKAGENTTVINKTEQVYVKEESSINKITNQIVPAIVNIISYPEKDSQKANEIKLIENMNGTGEIMTSDGLIMTYASAIIPDYFSNQGVSVEDIERVFKVIANDGNVYDAKLLAIDSWSNLAFLKIEASNLPVISLGNSDEYNPGEKVIAINNNGLDYQNKFTAGLLSSFESDYSISGEAVSKAEKLEGVFLTDFNKEIASPGGLIVDYSGQIIGITGATIKNGTLDYFQIPSNKIKMVLEKVIADEIASNISLGAYYLPITKTTALLKKLSINQGDLIYSPSGQEGLAIINNSNADKAGLKINDIITKVDDKEISLKNSLSNVLYKYKKGEKAEFTVSRSGKEIKVEVSF